jgi:uncharacterized protein (TIGR02246 family)
MSTCHAARVAVFALTVTVAAAPFASGEAAGRDEQELRAASRRYREALDRGDGRALAALWTADGDIIDGQGAVLQGRATVAATVKPAADAPATSFKIGDTKIRFLTDVVALEDGTVTVDVPGLASPLKGRFSATWVREADGWKIAALREDRLDAPAGGETLADLDWMVGDWVVVDDRAGKPAAEGPEKPAIEMTVRWNAKRTFLLRDVKIPAPGDDADALHVTQRIGWDPLSRQIRSWVFSSDGGHGEAVWERDGDSWVARTTAVLPDGSQTSSLNIYTFDGKNRCAWRSLPTHVGGEHTPPVNMTMIRKGEKP